VAALFEKALGKTGGSQQTLLELGGDSLSAVQIGLFFFSSFSSFSFSRSLTFPFSFLVLTFPRSIAQGLSDVFKVDVSVDVLFGHAATVDDVARLIDQSKKVGNGEILAGGHGSDGVPPQAKSKAINFKKEVILDPSIVLLPAKKELIDAPSRLVYHNVFLTGCTGFLFPFLLYPLVFSVSFPFSRSHFFKYTVPLYFSFLLSLSCSLFLFLWYLLLIFSSTGFFGPFLLEQILVQCSEAQVYCLIRAATPEQGKERILKGMAEAQVLVDENAQKRIIPVSE